MLRMKRRSAVVASASIFGALYALLGAIPVSRLVLGSGFLTAGNIVSPLAGMLFGPIVGGGAVLMGDLIDLYAGQLSTGATALAVMAADVAVVATAGLAFSKREFAALAIPVAALLAYTVDPISVLVVSGVPFAWLHLVSVVVLVVAIGLERRGSVGRLSPVYVSAVAFGALMCGQLVGTVVGQNLLVRVYSVYTVPAWRGLMSTVVFAAYPVERIFFSVAGSIVAVPVLRAVSGRRRREPTTSQ